MLVLKSPPTLAANRLDLMAPPRTGAKSLHIRILPGLMGDLDAWIAAQPGPRLLRVEGVRHLVKERLAGEPAPAPAAPSEDTAELRRRLIALGSKLDGLLAYTKEVERQRDALAARAPRLEVVSPGEQFGVRQSPREPPNVERWPADRRGDPETVARARAQLAAAEAAAEARRREELRSE
jgi:hypothetical protein